MALAAEHCVDNFKLDSFRRLLRELMPALTDRFAVQRLRLFGSYVRGASSSASDLDVLATFHRTPSLFKLGELEDLLTDSLGVKVDLVPETSLKPSLLQRVLREAVDL